MAGDWIKLQKDTPDKPEILAIATRLGIDPDAVVGKMVRIWSWFDTHTTDGNATSVTFSFVDRLTGVTGFAEQVALVGWLEQNGHDLRLPNFDYHNGKTSKTRALGKNRSEKHRSNGNSNDAGVTKTSPEKRRGEKNIDHARFVAIYNEVLPELPSVTMVTDKRKKAMRSFFDWVLTSKRSDGGRRAENDEQAFDYIRRYFERVKANPFLMGQHKSTGAHANWRADFDFLLTEKGRVHVIEKTEVQA